MRPLPSIKSTSGEGFFVEDAVAAFLAAHLLSGVSWVGAGEGEILSIQCQMRQDGWLFDDIVLQLKHAQVERKCACSIKSFAVFGKEGSPQDFTKALWEQWLDSTSSGFQQDADSITLIAAHHEPQIREAWIGLCDSARVMSPEKLVNRCVSGVEPSPLRRAAFKSLQMSGKNSEPVREPVEVARLLRRFRLAEHDFHHAESQSTTHAILLCQQALTDVERSRASELWEALVVFCAGVRRKGGEITLPNLLAELGHRFSLKQHPRYAADWSTILAESRQRIDVLPMKIGGLICVERSALVGRLHDLANSQSAVVILGESGNGKSVLARGWAGEKNAVWIRAGDLSTVGGLRSLFQLSHGIPELFANTSQPLHLVLDGLDKCFDETAFDEAALVLRSSFGAENSEHWKIAITCCPEDWERVRGQLIRRGILLPGVTVNVSRFSDSELRQAFEGVPSLRILRQRPHLHPILRWPKALDIVATYWQPGDSALPWATESDFARWFWRIAVRRDEPTSFRDRVARKLAVLLADRMAASVSLDEFQRDEAEACAELTREGHLEIDQTRQTVRFSHELIADWARQRELQVQGDSAAPYLRTRMHSPFWHRAVRFHGLDLLESQPDFEAWQRLFLTFDANSPVDEMARNLLLEAPIFAFGQRTVLDRLWPLFQLNEGELLSRFLRQFLHTATIPDEETVARFRSHSPDLQLEAAALYRFPLWQYWIGTLAFLGEHAEEVTGLAPEEVADVCLLWLSLHGGTLLGMKDAALLAVAAASRLYRSGEDPQGGYQEVSPEEKICRALLAASAVMPAEVTELALKLSGRKLPDAEDNLPQEEEDHYSIFRPDPGPPVPWPEGPQRLVVKVFQRAFLDQNHVVPFIRALPEVAAEVMFAVLLNIPNQNSYPDDHGFHLDENGFSRDDHRHGSPLWISGPFLTFLRINPAVGLPAIIRLVNFATARANELPEDLRQRFVVPVTVDGQVRIWRGHQYSYLWHQGHVFGPRAVGCALLSLEKWLYLLMDENLPFEEHLTTILRESDSIALAAVLICVGKRRPELFLGPLRPLVEAIDFFWIERVFARNVEGEFRASHFSEVFSETLRGMWFEWAQMPHRKETFEQLVMRMFLGNLEWREMISELRGKWQRRLDSARDEYPAPPWLPNIVSQFDLANWHTAPTAEGLLIQYEPPADLPQPTEAELARMKRLELITLLPFQCRQALMDERECTEEQISEWWSQLEEIRALQTQEEERGFRSKEDALCGIAAVAVVKQRAWLAADPAREEEAISIFAGIGTNPPKRLWLGESDLSDYKWDNFLAWGMATLWCEHPNDPSLLHAVGVLVLWDRNVVASRTMAIASKHRVELGVRFDQLLAHAIQYAPARHRAQMEQHIPKKTFDRDGWVATHLEKFVVGKTDPLPISWKLLGLPQKRRGRKAVSLSGGFDISYMLAVSSWAEDLTSCSDAAERRKWLDLHRETLLCALTRIEAVLATPPDPEPYYDHGTYSPYDDERNLLYRIARLVAHLAPGENHREFWEPIFALGCEGGNWVDTFIGTWLIEAAGHDEPSPCFTEQWLAMLSYAESSPAWKWKKGRRSSSRDIWNSLLGLSTFSPDFWSDRLAPAVESARDFHERWARTHLQNEHETRSLIRFFKSPAARRLRLDGLKLLHECSPIADRYFWRGEDIRDSFASFLRFLLDEHWHEVCSDPLAKTAFMAFALKLSSLQHPLGVEVLTNAGTRLGTPNL